MQIDCRNIILLILLILCIDCSYAGDNIEHHFIAVSDIHYDPVIECRPSDIFCNITQKIIRNTVVGWNSIIPKHEEQYENQPYHDTFDPLFKSFLTDLAKTAETIKPEFITINGDLFAHYLHMQYMQSMLTSTIGQYNEFLYNTTRYIANGLYNAYPVPVLPVVGNVDTNLSDYEYHPNSIYNRKITEIWLPFVKPMVNAAEFRHTFNMGGYYTATLPNTNQKLIIINTVLFSSRQPKQFREYADRQLQWLEQQLTQTTKMHTKVWIFMHIPPGVDTYKEAHLPGGHTEFWSPIYKQRFIALLKTYPTAISVIFSGHEHNDLIKSSHHIPLISIPSISPIFGNNPAYKIIHFNPKNMKVGDFTTRYLPLSDHIKKPEWKRAYRFTQLYHSESYPLDLIIHSIANADHQFDRYKAWIYGNGRYLARYEYPYYRCSIIHSQVPLKYQMCLEYKAY